MRMKEVIAAATIPAMVSSPAAAANPAASLSLRGESTEAGSPAATPTIGDSDAAQDLGGGGGISPALLVGGLALVLVIVGAVALGSGHHGSRPASM
jgi:hypothetical protein